MQERLLRTPWEEEQVNGGFGKEVVDEDVLGGVVDHARGGEGFGGGDIGA